MGFHVYDTETKDFNEILTAEALSKKVYDTLNYYQKRGEMLTKANQELMNDAMSGVVGGVVKDILSGKITPEQINDLSKRFPGKKE